MTDLSPDKRRKVHAALGALPADATFGFAQAAGAFAPFEPFLAKLSVERQPGVILPDDLKTVWRVAASNPDVRDLVGEFAAANLGAGGGDGLDEARRVAWRAMSDALDAPQFEAARWALKGAGEIDMAFRAWSTKMVIGEYSFNELERVHAKWARVQPAFAAMLFASAADRLSDPTAAAALLDRLRASAKLAPSAIKDHALRARALLAARQGPEAAAAFSAAFAERSGGRPLHDLFFAPLDPWRRGPSQPDGEIDDAAIQAAWAFLNAVDDEAFAIASANAEAERQVGDQRAAAAAFDHVRPASGERLSTALRLETAPKALQTPAGWAIARLLACADRLREVFPADGAAVAELDPALATLIRNFVDAETEVAPQAAPPFGPLLLLGVMRRLRRPAQVMRALSAVMRRRYDMSIDRTDFGVIGHRLIDEAERVAVAFKDGVRARGGETRRAADLLAALDRYSWIVWGLAEEFDVYREGPWGKRLYALKSAAAGDLEALCAACVKAIEAACPRARGAQKMDAPALDGPLRPEIADAALQAALFLEGSAMADERAAFVGARAKSKRASSERIGRQLDDLLRAARDPACAQREVAAAQIIVLVEIAGVLDGVETANLWRRRLAAAA